MCNFCMEMNRVVGESFRSRLLFIFYKQLSHLAWGNRGIAQSVRTPTMHAVDYACYAMQPVMQAISVIKIIKAK